MGCFSTASRGSVYPYPTRLPNLSMVAGAPGASTRSAPVPVVVVSRKRLATATALRECPLWSKSCVSRAERFCWGTLYTLVLYTPA